jgi:hypothetical protein
MPLHGLAVALNARQGSDRERGAVPGWPGRPARGVPAQWACALSVAVMRPNLARRKSSQAAVLIFGVVFGAAG